jgi:tRNA pseudouridine55 synthase
MREPADSAGVLLVDKPAGVTSHDVVSEIRAESGLKAGHAGTLDPFATGLLVVLLGRATRLQRYLLALPKTYRATARLGWRSTTGDPDGELTETGRVPKRLELPTGEVRQRTPMTSAARVGGERLYRKAHRGESVQTPERTVRVHRAELLDSDAEHAEFEIECSTGTYVRSLIETLEDAYCSALRRIAVGALRAPDAGPERLSVEQAMGYLPERRLSGEEAESVSHGRGVAAGNGPGEQPARLTFEGRLLAIARRDDDELRPEVVLA